MAYNCLEDPSDNITTKGASALTENPLVKSSMTEEVSIDVMSIFIALENKLKDFCILTFFAKKGYFLLSCVQNYIQKKYV